MIEKNYFETPPSGEPGQYGRWVGKFGNWILHIAKVAFLVYSGYHGVSAAISYAGNSQLAMAAQIFGIVVLECVLFGLYLAWHNQQITGVHQSVAAAATYAIGFVLACLGIVGDSQLHAAGVAAPWLVSYLTWGLPVAPAVMALGALLVHELAPHQLRSRKWQEQHRQLEELQFDGWAASQQAERELAIKLKNMQLNAQATAVQHALDWYMGSEAQTAVKDAARKNAPALLAAALGIDVSAIQQSSVPLPPAPVGASAGQPAVPERFYTLCRVEGDHGVAVDYGSLAAVRASMAQRKAHLPNSKFYIITADTFEYVEGDLINGVTPQTKAQEDASFFGQKKKISPSDLSRPPWRMSDPVFNFWAEGEAMRLKVPVEDVVAAWQQHGASKMFPPHLDEDDVSDGLGNGVNHPPLVS